MARAARPDRAVPQWPVRLRLALAPTHTFWFGTDALGRDLYSRLIFGTRTSLLIAVLANLIATTVALILGTLAGYFGGLADTLIMRLTDVLISFPVLLLAAFLATPFSAAVPRKAAEKWGSDFSHHVVANGPFLLESCVPGQKVVLTRNPNYFDKSNAAHLDRIEFLVGLSEQVSLLRAQSGQVDVLGNGIPSAQFVSITSNPRFKPYMKSLVQVGTYYLFMNTQKAPFTNKLVREAVSAAIDKKRLVQLQNGRGKTTAQILPPGMPGYDPSVKESAPDAARGAALLKQAGYQQGAPLTLITTADEPGPKLAQAVQQQLAAIGMKVSIKALPGAEYINTITTPGTTAIGISAWFQDYPDPSDFLDVLFESGYYQPGGFNLAGYKNPAVDAQLAKLRGLPLKQALPGYQQVQKQILADFPWVPLHNPAQYDFVNPRLTNVSVHPVWNYVYQDWNFK